VITKPYSIVVSSSSSSSRSPMPVSELNLKVNISVGNEYLQDNGHTQLMFIFWGVIIPIIGVIGFIGNILTLIVLFNREMTSTTVYFLRTLVVTDTGIIVGFDAHAHASKKIVAYSNSKRE
ncbi:FMRFamide receptor-like, partial [Dreissena polymorpha]|uniref:FMRFamide receptor-like n=1 Tax=Dreissena polymorpha TaxID=45954 RepID=UPI00226455BD